MEDYKKPTIVLSPKSNAVAPLAPLAAGVGFLTAVSGDDVIHLEHMDSLVKRKDFTN